MNKAIIDPACDNLQVGEVSPVLINETLFLFFSLSEKKPFFLVVLGALPWFCW